MSRNFELLQQVGKEQEIFPTVIAPPREVFEEPVPFTVAPMPFVGAGAEEITALVQRVFLLTGREAPRTVVFAGLESGNGCTWMCARAGEALASQISGTVCLVDANLRNPQLHGQLGVPNHYGLSDALLRAEPVSNFVTQLSRPNLATLSCGANPEKAQALLTSDRMRGRLSELRSIFDYVLIDASALNSAKEAIALGAASDGVILVLKANSSRRETARSAVQELQTAKIRVLGAVLNQRTFPIPEAIYSRL
jgi:succinoglycan biosynthesis transport protein ExoP